MQKWIDLGVLHLCKQSHVFNGNERSFVFEDMKSILLLTIDESQQAWVSLKVID